MLTTFPLREYREWYSLAPFSHPHPASPTILHALFPSYSLTYLPSLIPPYSITSNNTSSSPSSPLPQTQGSAVGAATTTTTTTTTSRALGLGLGGESPSQLHTRVATALSRIISNADVESGAEEEEEVAILICTHAATMIAAGRVLTGVMPRDINEPDFRAFTCGLSKFVRRRRPLPLPRRERERERERGWEDESSAPPLHPSQRVGKGMLPDAAWMNGKGVAGGWDCLLNSDCTHLSGGEERGW